MKSFTLCKIWCRKYLSILYEKSYCRSVNTPRAKNNGKFKSHWYMYSKEREAARHELRSVNKIYSKNRTHVNGTIHVDKLCIAHDTRYLSPLSISIPHLFRGQTKA